MHLKDLEEYLAGLTDYSQEQLDNVRKVRTEWQHMSFEQYQFLFTHGAINRFVKLKTPRNLFVCSEGKIHYLNHYRKWYQCIGELKES